MQRVICKSLWRAAFESGCWHHHGPDLSVSKYLPYTVALHNHHHRFHRRNDLFIIPRRHLSIDTYMNYFSPSVPPIGFAQQVLEKVHDCTGLPWWGSIIVTTFALRTVVTLPLAVYSNYVLIKVKNLQPEIVNISKVVMSEVSMAAKNFNWNKHYARLKYNMTMKKLIRDLYIRDNCHPFKASVVVFVQIPMWVFLSFALRNMSGMVPISGMKMHPLCPDLKTEGILWIPDLTLTDTTWILPIAVGLFNLITIELQSLQPGKRTRFQKIVTASMRTLSVALVPIAACVPSCMVLYWCSSSLFGLVQNIALKMPRVRNALGIPLMKGESTTPIKDLGQLARTKYTWRRKSKDSDKHPER